MTSSAPYGTIQRTVASRPDLLAFDILDRIPADDMDWMAKEIDGAFESFPEIDMLLVMRRFEGADAGAFFDPKVLKVQLRSLGKVRRYAVVGAPAWARTMIEALDWIMPVDAKTFDLAEEADARFWVEDSPRAR